MNSNKDESEPLNNLTDSQIEELVKSNEALDEEEERIKRENIEEIKRKKYEKEFFNKPLARLRKTPLEIINRSLFFLFIGSFLFSFISVYSVNPLWFFLYLTSSFSCIFYTPNRKALKELLAAWPNIVDLIKGRSLWK
tara:strand:- start:742 stop:1155 length:414 start_codon:yes stop_codon:yes gene_type:complete